MDKQAVFFKPFKPLEAAFTGPVRILAPRSAPLRPLL